MVFDILGLVVVVVLVVFLCCGILVVWCFGVLVVGFGCGLFGFLLVEFLFYGMITVLGLVG